MISVGKLLTAGAAMALLIGMASSASANLIVDGDFDNSIPSFTTYNAGSSFGAVASPAAWLVTNGPNDPVSGGSVDLIGGYWQSPTPTLSGSGSVDLDGNAPGGISQTVATIVGQTYTLSYELSGNPDGGSSTKTVSANGSVSTYMTGSNTRTSMDYVPESVTFQATSATTTISFISQDDASSPYGPVIGDVSLTATPIPPAIALFGGGLGLIGLIAKRKRRHQDVSRLGIAA
jgi:choice-of-anchor C domain-containing protein